MDEEDLDRDGWDGWDKKMMKRGGDDADEARAALPAMKPWWRSVGFWLGLSVMMFLVWVWRDSFSHGSNVGRVQRVSHGVQWVRLPPWMVSLDYGAVEYQRVRVLNDPRDVVMGPTLPIGHWRNGAMELRPPGWWGSSRKEVDLANPIVFEVRQWWFSFGFVVVGYGMVWIGLLVGLRWWMRRRWERSKVVEG